MINQESQNTAGNSMPPELNVNSTICPHCGHANPSWRSTCENCDQSLSGDTKPVVNGKTLKPKASVGGGCQNCNTRAGEPYSFHYLKHIGTGKTALYSDYHDGGIETTFLCDQCVAKHRIKESIQIGFFVILFLTASFLSLVFFVKIMAQTNYFSAIFLASGLTTLVLGIGSVVLLVKSAMGGVNFSGVSLAMKLWKKWLTEQGFTTLLYEDEYQKLKAKK